MIRQSWQWRIPWKTFPTTMTNGGPRRYGEDKLHH